MLCPWPAESNPGHYSRVTLTFYQSDSFAAIKYGKATALLPPVRKGTQRLQPVKFQQRVNSPISPLYNTFTRLGKKKDPTLMV